tara:strand:+ start:224 stop:1075 length:852 start_codon:yes stop_codon:yes gene_type:complete
MSAAAVAQSAKTNRTLTEMKAQNAEQTRLQRENVKLNQGILYTSQVGNQLSEKQIQATEKQTYEITEGQQKIRRAISEVAALQQATNQILRAVERSNHEILIEQKKSNILIMADSEREKFQFELLRNEKKLERLEEQRFKNMHEVLFQVSEDLADIPNSPKHKIEIFFQLESLLANCKDAGIATDQVVDLDLKKKIDDTYKNIEAEINDCLSKLSAEENEDLGDILDILSEDEESSIAAEEIVIDKNKRKRDVITNEINAANTSIINLKEEIRELEEVISQNS